MDIPSGEREYLPFVLDEFVKILDKVKERSESSSLSAKSDDQRAFLQSQLNSQRSSIIKAYKYISRFRKHLSGDIGESEIEPLATALSIGFLIGHSLKLDAFNFEEFQGILASTIGRKNVNRGRHDLKKAIKQRLVAQAEEAWSSGSNLFHNEMTKKLIENNPEYKEIISEYVLMVALRPIATRYDKVRGMKGTRRKKLPPK